MRYKDKAILVVSFGTSAKQTGIAVIDQIESKIRDTFPAYAVYRAWTSKRIRKKLLEQENLNIDSVSEALGKMKKEGIRKVIVQPTFVTNGEENRRMREEALAYAKDFLTLEFGAPLLESPSDVTAVAEAIALEADSSFPAKDRNMVVFMGHGISKNENILLSLSKETDGSLNTGDSISTADPDSVYALVDRTFKELGYPNLFLRLMNSESAIFEILDLAKKQAPEKVVLMPFMIVAGRHALKDMAGDGETSWAAQLKAAGFSVQCIFKGLGEYPVIQDLFMKHIKNAIQATETNCCKIDE